MKAIFALLFGLVAIVNEIRAQTTSLPVEKCPFVECMCQIARETEISVYCSSPTKEEKFPSRQDRFNTSTQINYLAISHYIFSDLPANAFSGLRIRSLTLEFNEIKTIQEASFNGIIGLEELKISQQNVETVQPKSLDPIRSTLLRMTLQNDQTAKSILSDSAVTFTKLNQLTLYMLTTIDPNMFINLPELTYLTLMSVPKIFDKPLTGYFTENPKLVSITLSSNTIKKMSYVLDLLDNVKRQITYLDLSYNQIAEIPEEINSFSNLVELNLVSNVIWSIKNTTFRGLTELSTLSLAHNGMDGPRDAFKYNKKLTDVYLASNSFGEIHDFTGARVSWVSYENQNRYLLNLTDYEFDYPKTNWTKSLSLLLSSNNLRILGSRLFCSRSKTQDLVYISQLYIDYKPFAQMDLCLLRQMGLRNGKTGNTNLFVMNPSMEPVTEMCKCEYFEYLKRYNIKLSLTGCSVYCKDVVSSNYLDAFDKDCNSDAKKQFWCFNSTSSLSNFGFNTFILNLCLLMVFIFGYIKF